jgi:hypothetical protein
MAPAPPRVQCAQIRRKDPARHDALRRFILETVSPLRSVDFIEAADACGIAVLESDGVEALAAPFEDRCAPLLRISPGTNRLAFALALAAAALRPGFRGGMGDPAVIRDPEVSPLARDLLLPPPALAALPAVERTPDTSARRFRLPEPLVLLCLGRSPGPCPV